MESWGRRGRGQRGGSQRKMDRDGTSPICRLDGGWVSVVVVAHCTSLVDVWEGRSGRGWGDGYTTGTGTLLLVHVLCWLCVWDEPATFKSQERQAQNSPRELVRKIGNLLRLPVPGTTDRMDSGSLDIIILSSPHPFFP